MRWKKIKSNLGGHYLKKAIITGGTRQDFEAMATLVMNIMDVMPELNADIIIFHDGISKEDRHQLTAIYPVRFIKYKAPIHFWQMYTNPNIRYFSSVIFCKYETLRMLGEYESVMWTDYDVIIKEDISNLFESCRGATFVTNGTAKLKDMFYEKSLSRLQQKFGNEFELDKDAVTTPLFIFSRDIGDYNQYYRWCNKVTQKYCRYLSLPEQATFSMMLQKFDVSYDELSNEIYALHPKYDKETAKIVHAYGQPKFWNGYNDERWNMYNKKWRESKR